MADQDTTLREDIEAAAAEVEDEAPAEETHEIEATATEEAAQETTEEVSAEAGEPDTGEPAEVEPAVEAAAPVAHKPPVDWAPEVKAKWSELTPDVQAAIAERERGINDTLAQTADIRHAYDSFNEMLAPYAPLMQAEGATDPTVAIKGLLDTTAALMLGSPQQKAQRIAGLINHYQVDVQTLADALDGKPSGDPATDRFEQMLNQRLAPVNDLLARVQQTEAQAQGQARAEATQNIHQFAADPQNVHFDSVRDTMADFLDMAAQRGQDMTLQEAYQRACLADPQIAPLVTQQFAQQAAAGHQQTVAGKRNAASSIAGKPAASASSGLTEDMSLRETIAAQFGGGGRI